MLESSGRGKEVLNYYVLWVRVKYTMEFRCSHHMIGKYDTGTVQSPRNDCSTSVDMLSAVFHVRDAKYIV